MSSNAPPSLSPDISSDFSDLEHLTTRFLEYPHGLQDYLDEFLPCTAPCLSHKSDPGNNSTLVSSQSSDLLRSHLAGSGNSGLSGDGSSEANGMKERILVTLRRVTSCCSQRHNFQFSAADALLQTTSFEPALLCASFPGQALPSDPAPRDVSCYIPVLPLDPFERKRKSLHFETTRALLHLSHLARSLLVAHSALYVFLLVLIPCAQSDGNEDEDGAGVVRMARIVRVDRSSAIVSQAFHFDHDRPINVLRQFFCRLDMSRDAQNLNAGGSSVGRSQKTRAVAGGDPSVWEPTESDIAWAKSVLRRGEEWPEEDVRASRWLRIRLVPPSGPAGAETYGDFLALRALFVSKHVFGRCTVVWECVRRGDSEQMAGKRYVIKDAWPVRHAAQRSSRKCEEFDFYDRINAIHGDPVGLARVIAVQRAGKGEVPTDQEETKDDDDIDDRLRCRKSSSSQYSDGSRSSRSCSTTERSTVRPSSPSHPRSSGFESAVQACQADSSPRRGLSSSSKTSVACASLRTTVLPALGRDAVVKQLQQRSHVRLVFDTLARPLSSFKSTKEMTTATRDAIIGHKNAFDAGILHRDVSDTNILITDDPSKPFRGLLTDFDYSTFTDLVSASSKYRETRGNARLGCSWTGTLPFMAIELLSGKGIQHSPRHDLESFYWVIVATVLRCTMHTHPLGPLAYASLFNPGPKETHVNQGNQSPPFNFITALRNQKILWFYDTQVCPLEVKDNAPLSGLLSELRVMFWRGSASGAPGYVEIVYEKLLGLFERALASEGWPEDDGAIVK